MYPHERSLVEEMKDKPFALIGVNSDQTIERAKKAIADKKVTILDVNGSRSFAKRHIPTAIDFSKAGKELAASLPKDKGALIVAYCGGPSCGAYKRAASAAEKLGYTNVKHLSAGISGWLKAGEDTEKSEKKK